MQDYSRLGCQLLMAVQLCSSWMFSSGYSGVGHQSDNIPWPKVPLFAGDQTHRRTYYVMLVLGAYYEVLQ